MTSERGEMVFRQIADGRLAQFTYLVGCRATGEALVIDPERDVERYVEIAAREGLRITAVAETHIHADFLSGARACAERCGARLYLSGEGGPDWQSRWAVEGDYEVTLLRDGSLIEVGDVELRAVHTPGHTPEHVVFLIRDRAAGDGKPSKALTGDFVFVGDLGRPDLLESAAGVAGMMDRSARALYASVEKAMAWPDELEIWPGHGAGSSCGKSLGEAPSTTWGAEKHGSLALHAWARGEEAFVDFILDGQPEPPLYFARMKRLNRDGVPLLGETKTPPRLEASRLLGVLGSEGVAVLDTRDDLAAWASGHLSGSLHAPLDETFHAVVGSYVDPESTLYLVAEEARVEALVIDLQRIGFDRVGGWLDPALLGDEAIGGAVSSTAIVDFPVAERLLSGPGTVALDVRGAAEFADGDGLPGAINVAHTRLWDRLKEVPTHDTVLVYCGSGRRAARAASLLEREGRDVLIVHDMLRNRTARSDASSAAAV